MLPASLETGSKLLLVCGCTAFHVSQGVLPACSPLTLNDTRILCISVLGCACCTQGGCKALAAPKEATSSSCSKAYASAMSRLQACS